MNGKEFTMILADAKINGKEMIGISVIEIPHTIRIHIDCITVLDSVIQYRTLENICYICLDKVLTFYFD